MSVEAHTTASGPIRRAVTVLLLICALLLPTAACGGGDDNDGAGAATPAAVETTSSAQARKFAKTRFVANAGLAAGATYQWIVKPYRAGKFKKDASGRKYALIKAGLAGAFAYNRLKAAAENAKGDPLLAKAMGPLDAGIASLKGIGAKLGKGEAGSAEVGMFETVINDVKGAGSGAGAVVKDKVPSVTQLSRS
ncbi:hypothetical protein [Streptomyces sp. MnatMP-M17]|uniref:hypothetical protein n=1 Tax=unclassified Streptomyces TaxID=2593676 RepID=UPI00081D6A01|nr:hypothetical protein [Streptomyces sp. MnatMP-M17]MYZ39371.1 hypothetical protein [Streptomyces sp. SID4917]SCG03488.1 hypothetical protein GA0115259_108372 [Streptomyces sp. MnatMP-M17]